MLGTTFHCECGREHRVPIREVVYAEDALARLPGAAADLDAGMHVGLVADQRTYAVAGEAARDRLCAEGFDVALHILPDPPAGSPVCDDVTRLAVEEALPERIRALVAVGSGVVNDLCKWIGTDTGRPYVVMATAASMNGYASANIAPAIRGVKRVLPGVVPPSILATPSVIANAPYELTSAGLGDVLAKPVSITDWKINHLLFDEYYCPLCARLIREFEPAYMEHPERIREHDPAAIEALFQALIYSGIAMTIADTSFPASGGEHLVSHVLDMTAPLDNVAHDYHGRQVGLGAVFASALYDRLAALEDPEFAVRVEETDAGYWKTLAPVVEEEHAGKRQRARRAVERLREPGTWDAARQVMAESAMPAATVKDCLKRAGAAHCIGDIGCSRDRFAAAAVHAHQIRERYTVVDLARAAGILPHALEEIIDEHLVD